MKNMTKKIDGIIALVLGIVILIFPFTVFNIMAFIIGIILIIAGAKRFYEKLQAKSKRIVNSLLMIAIGVVLVFFNQFSRNVLGYLVGGLFIYNGILRLVKYNKVKTPMNKSLASAGIVAMVIGVVVVIFPGIIIIAFNTLIALLLIGYGVLRLFIKFNFAGKMSKFKNELDDDQVVDVDSE